MTFEQWWMNHPISDEHWEDIARAAWNAAIAEAREAVLNKIAEVFRAASDERLTDQEKAHVEASKWKAEGDMYGWNFHEGMAAGMNWADIIFHRVMREIDAQRSSTLAAPDAGKEAAHGRDG